MTIENERSKIIRQNSSRSSRRKKRIEEKSRGGLNNTSESRNAESRKSMREINWNSENCLSKYLQRNKGEGFFYSNSKEKKKSKNHQDRITAEKSNRGNRKDESSSNSSKKPTESSDH
jgi:hypothetical protein